MNQDVRNRAAESIIVVALLGAAWFVLVEPLRTRADKAEERVQTLQGELDSYKATIDLPPDQAQRYMSRIDQLVALAAPRTALAEHEQILDLAKRAGIAVARINPSPEDATSRMGPIFAGSRRFHVESSGSFAQIVNYLDALSEHAPMGVVDHFTISAPNPNDPEDLRLAASIKVGHVTAQRNDVAEVEP